MSEETTEERLVNALITKMESMESDINAVRRENEILKNMMNNPAALLKKSGFVRISTPLSEDVSGDAFRGEEAINLQKSEGQLDNYTNEQIHEMSWEEIHDMADNVKTPMELY
tara:strand:- start:10538 stop:10876 length:339 start_codon:yes stop_codon:yes gene_type:complete